MFILSTVLAVLLDSQSQPPIDTTMCKCEQRNYFSVDAFSPLSRITNVSGGYKETWLPLSFPPLISLSRYIVRSRSHTTFSPRPKRPTPTMGGRRNHHSPTPGNGARKHHPGEFVESAFEREVSAATRWTFSSSDFSLKNDSFFRVLIESSFSGSLVLVRLRPRDRSASVRWLQ